MKILEALPLIFDQFYTHDEELPHIFAPMDRLNKFILILQSDFGFTHFVQISSDFKKIILKNLVTGSFIVVEWGEHCSDLDFLKKFKTIHIHSEFEHKMPLIAKNPNRSEAPFKDEHHEWIKSTVSEFILLKHDQQTVKEYLLTKLPTFKTDFQDELFKTLIEEKLNDRILSFGIFHLRKLALKLKRIESHLRFLSQPSLKDVQWLEKEYAPEGYGRLLYKGLLIKSELIPPGWLLEVERSFETTIQGLKTLQKNEKRPIFTNRIKDLELQILESRGIVALLSSKNYQELSKSIELNASRVMTVDGFYYSLEAFFLDDEVLYSPSALTYLSSVMKNIEGLPLPDAQEHLRLLTMDLF